MGSVCRYDEYQNEKSENAFVHQLFFLVDSSDLLEERANNKKHHHNVNGREDERVNRTRKTACLSNGNNGYQQNPCSHIVDGSTADTDGAQVSFRKPFFLYDACQHRKSSNAHGNTDEQGERGKIGIGRRKIFVNNKCQYHPEHERDDNAGLADDKRVSDFILQLAHIQVHAYSKHKQNQAYLTDNV